jgi:CRISPR-associated Cas5-like protein
MNEMPLIVAVGMEGFKCFDQLRLDFGRLTLVTGFNGGGKSTALQPLLLLAQALHEVSGADALPLNGPLVRLGTAGDIAPLASERPMRLEVEGRDGTLVYLPALQAGDRILASVAPVEGLDQSELLLALKSLSYLGAVRIGAEDAFPIPELDHVPDVGHDGRFAPYWYDKLIDDDIDIRRRYPGSPATTFRKQLDAWLGSLFPGAEANVQNYVALSQMNLQFRLSELGSWRRPANIGYGLTYAFPILVALLCATENQVVVIDSPESHLHPSAQSQMGRILGSFANAGVQIIVETHSDHLLNGVRLAVREGTLLNDDLRIHFFQGAKGLEHGVTSPRIGAGGDIYEWPEGFFDQAEKDLSRLAGWS